MSNTVLKTVVLGAVLAVTAAASAAQAAPVPFCREYTADAIRQVREARSHPRRCDALVASFPARWTMNRRAHFDWCVSPNVSIAMADAERRARREGLEHCLR